MAGWEVAVHPDVVGTHIQRQRGVGRHQWPRRARVPEAGVELDRIEAHRDQAVGGIQQLIARLVAEQPHPAGELLGGHPGARTLEGGAVGQAAAAHKALQGIGHRGL